MNPDDDIVPGEEAMQPAEAAAPAHAVVDEGVSDAGLELFANVRTEVPEMPVEPVDVAPALTVPTGKAMLSTLTAARDAADFVARIFAEDAPVAPVVPVAVAPENWATEGSAQVKEETAKRAGDTEQSSLSPSFPDAAMQGQNILILGLGHSSLAMARWCVRCGATSVTVADTRAAPPQLATLQQELSRVRFVPGAFGAELVLGQDLHAVYRSPGLAPAEVATVLTAAQAQAIRIGGELSLYAEALRALRTARGYAPAVLAITGTNGKTTVTSLTGQLMAHAGKTVAVAGNIGPTLLDTLAAHLQANTLPQVWVLELSSFQLDGVQGFEPSAAVVLNVTQDHLDWHGALQAYAQAKARIFGSTGLMVLNREDPQVMAMLPQPTRVKLQRPEVRAHITFGTDMPQRPGDFGLEEVNGMVWLVRALQADETRKKRRDEEDELHIQRLMPADALRIRGRHNASNALAALALCAAVDCPLGPILFALREYRGEPHRVEPVGILNGIEFFDDSKGTNVGATVAALRGLGEERKVVVILGGEGKGQDFSPLAQPVARYARAVVLIGRDAALIHNAIAHTDVPVVLADSLESAVAQANQRAHAGDAVLMSPACASFDMFDNYEHRARVFCAAVNELATAMGMDMPGHTGMSA